MSNRITRTVGVLAVTSCALALYAMPAAAHAQAAKAPAAKNGAGAPAAKGKAAAAPEARTASAKSAARTAASARPAVPPPAAQDKALRSIRNAFAKELAKTSLRDKLALAAQFVDRATKAGKDDDATRYVMLRQASDLAAAGGDVGTALAAVDAMAARFQGVNTVSLKLAALATASKRFPPDPAQTKAVVDGHIAVSDDALRTGDLDGAMKIVADAEALAPAAKDPELNARVAERKKILQDLSAQYGTAVGAAREKLRTAPNDVAANTTLGNFYCFAAGDWQRGLPMLAKGGDKDLRKIATDDLAAAKLPPAGMAGVGDAWWELGDRQQGLGQRHARLRAAHWYKQSLSQLGGLQRVRVEKRIALIEPAFANAAPGGMARAGAAAPPVERAPAQGGGGAAGGGTGERLPGVATARTVDLMPYVDTAQDLLHQSGRWVLRPEGVVTAVDSRDVLMFAYRPPDEYDFVVEFTRLLGNEAVSHLMVKPGGRVAKEDRGFEWTIGGWGNRATGFRSISGKGPNEHASGKMIANTLENGRRYQAVVQVRKDRIRALVDNKLVNEWATNYSDVANPYLTEIGSARQGQFVNRLGLRTWDNVVVFHKAYVVEISGAGQPLRQPGQGGNSTTAGARGSGGAGGAQAGAGGAGQSGGAGSSGAGGPSGSGQPGAGGPGGPLAGGAPSGALPGIPGYPQPPAGGGAPDGGGVPPGMSPQAPPGGPPSNGGPPAGMSPQAPSGGPPANGGMPPGMSPQAPPGGPPANGGMPPGMSPTPPAGSGPPPPGGGPGMPGYPQPPPGGGAPPPGGGPNMPGYPQPPPGGGPPNGGMPPGAGPGAPPAGGGPPAGMPPGAGPGAAPGGGPPGGMPPGAGPGAPPGGGPPGGMPPGAGPGAPPGGSGPPGGMPPGAGPGAPPGGSGPPGGMPPGAGPAAPPGGSGPPGGMPPGAGPGAPPGGSGPPGGMPPGAGPSAPPGGGGPPGGMPPGAGPSAPPGGSGPPSGPPPGSGPGAPPGGSGPPSGPPPGSGPGAPPGGSGPPSGPPPGSGPSAPPGGGAPPSGPPSGSGPSAPPGGGPPSGGSGPSAPPSGPP